MLRIAIVAAASVVRGCSKIKFTRRRGGWQSARFLACVQGPITIGPYERLERLSFRFCKVYFLTVP